MLKEVFAYKEIQKYQSETNVLLKKVSDYIDAYTSRGPEATEVDQVIEDAVSARGKMLRPSLLLLCAEFGNNYQEERLCKLAALVEITHMASLVHDDVIDDAPERRGRPSVQGKYGKKAAVYAGDLMMCRVSLQVAKEDFNEYGEIISGAIEEMCRGELLQSGSLFDDTVTKDRYYRNIHGKTAALFMASCRIGAIEGGCDEKTVELLERIGEKFGMLFQLRDDLKDFSSESSEMGKTTHKDFLDGIYTFPVISAMKTEKGRKALLPLMKKNRMGLLSDGDLRMMEDVVKECGGIRETETEIRQHLGDIERILSEYGDFKPAIKIQQLIRKVCADL